MDIYFRTGQISSMESALEKNSLLLAQAAVIVGKNSGQPKFSPIIFYSWFSPLQISF
jgi:hypothetical protein